YKLKTEDATKISDLLITTQNLGKTTVDELASSMGSVIPIASAANYSIEELSTAYALMTKNGIATSEAGTYVKSMLSEITKSGSITDKALRELTHKGFADLKK
ncbi:phage tail tape measure protein, partial [Clostridium sp. DSM 1985]